MLYSIVLISTMTYAATVGTELAVTTPPARNAGGWSGHALRIGYISPDSVVWLHITATKEGRVQTAPGCGPLAFLAGRSNIVPRCRRG